MTFTGSMINHLSGNANYPTPEVGMGATILMWSDRYATTIIEVSENGKQVVVQEDHAKRTDSNGMSDSQTYEYSPNPEGPTVTYTLRKNGAWVRKGDPMKTGERLAIGRRDHHYDFTL